MFKGARGLIATLLGAALIITLAIVFGFRDQKDDAATARAFLTHLGEDEFAQAHGLLHLHEQRSMTVQNFSAIFRDLEPYVEIRFPSVSFSTINGTRTSVLTGTARTETGCESDVEIHLLDGGIRSYRIAPLCREDGIST